MRRNGKARRLSIPTAKRHEMTSRAGPACGARDRPTPRDSSLRNDWGNVMSQVFGPVPSRRLGRSLGVDLVPFKTCSYDCIYCQLGRTTEKTLERRAWTSVDSVLGEIKEKLATKPDYITLSGSGEPTLCTRLGDLIEGVRSITTIPVAVLTNGSLLWKPEVRQEIIGANLIVPSLDAGDARLFEAVNRPAGGLVFEQMVDGLGAMREEFAGDFWLEVFLLDGYTADIPEIKKINAHVKRIKPDRVQINTVTRPPAEPFARAATRPKLEELTRFFTQEAEVIADFQAVHAQADFTATRDAVLQLLERRPCSLDDLREGLGIHRNEIVKYIEELLATGQIEIVKAADLTFYRAARARSRPVRGHQRS
jgi:wyosine [tRNA(Phe)-imidazoG37] synthetase (radical SAM superfamily)